MEPSQRATAPTCARGGIGRRRRLGAAGLGPQDVSVRVRPGARLCCVPAVYTDVRDLDVSCADNHLVGVGFVCEHIAKKRPRTQPSRRFVFSPGHEAHSHSHRLRGRARRMRQHYQQQQLIIDPCWGALSESMDRIRSHVFSLGDGTPEGRLRPWMHRHRLLREHGDRQRQIDPSIYSLGNERSR